MNTVFAVTNALPELWCVGAPGGLATHLFSAADLTVLCHGLASGQLVVGPGVTPFAMLGCRRCARAALKLGYQHIVDVDGSLVVLAGFTPIA